MIEYVRATASDRAAMLDFGNMVFSMSGHPHDFKSLIPKFYGDGKPSEDKSFLAKEDGVLRAMVAVCERPMRVCGETLKVGLVGTVSAHPYDRGKGHMSHLLDMVIKDAAQSGTDLMALGGRRQRYGHYGFESCGTEAQFSLVHDNIKHCFGALDAGGVTFSEITDNEDPRLDKAFALYDRQPVAGMRTREDFLDTARTWNAKLYAVEEDGVMIGYLINESMEIRLEDDGKLPLVLKAYDAFTGGKSVSLPCPPQDAERIKFLSGICEYVGIVAPHRVNILNFERVAGAYMKLLAMIGSPEDGRAVLDIKGCERLLFAVEGGKTSVTSTDEAADLSLSKNEAEMLLFMPTTALIRQPKCFKNWFPLPLHIPNADMF